MSLWFLTVVGSLDLLEMHFSQAYEKLAVEPAHH